MPRTDQGSGSGDKVIEEAVKGLLRVFVLPQGGPTKRIMEEHLHALVAAALAQDREERVPYATHITWDAQGNRIVTPIPAPSEPPAPACNETTPDPGRTHHVGDDCPGGHAEPEDPPPGESEKPAGEPAGLTEGCRCDSCDRLSELQVSFGLRAMVDCHTTDSDHCRFCEGDAARNAHASGCVVVAARAALEPEP